jgi:hypothetical protein
MRIMWVMRRIFLSGLAAGALAVALFAGCKTGHQSKATVVKQALAWREVFDIATEAYIFGYPLVTMDLTRRAMTNVREPEGMHAPMGQFARTRTYPLASNHDVAVPNADTLHTIVWLDVSHEPWVISLPDTQGRYCLFPMLDGWTTVFGAPGKRTTGTGPQKVAITGPGWKGKLPSGLKEYKSPTGIVWMLGRIYCTGTPGDYTAVHALQDQCSATPLNSYGKPYTPSPGQIDPNVNTTKTVREQVGSLAVADYFNRLALLMKDNPPSHADARIVKRMARLGIIPGQPFDINKLDPAVIQVLQNVPKAAFDKIIARPTEHASAGDSASKNGWTFPLKTGVYGTDYAQRALIAAVGLGANRPQDSVFAISTIDGTEQPYSGNSSYVMHFAPGQAPSANGFWSLTMYDGNYFFVDSPLGRHTLSARDPLKFNPDGSLDLCIQKYPPGMDRESNWLPAPGGKFVLMLRFYWPKQPLIDGSWKIPPVKRVD